MDEPRIVVVGAGLAGLTCAYRLHQAGLPVTVFEARDRVGGRCWSDRGIVDGQVAEHGGEFIDPSHEHLLAFVRELGLELEDRAPAGAAAHAAGRIFLDGRELGRSEAPIDELVEALARDAERIGDVAYDRAGKEAIAFDEMSVIEWLDENIDGGSASTIGRIAATAVAQNLGMAAAELSAIVLLVDFLQVDLVQGEVVPPSMFDIVDAIVFSLHVRGGNDLVPAAIADALPGGALRLGSPLERISRHADGRYRLRIAGVREEVVADRVVLALPFPALRRTEMDDAGLSQHKRRCIEELTMGANTKLLLGLDRPMSQLAPATGWATFESADVTAWDASLAQSGVGGIATVFTAGKLFSSDGESGHGIPVSAEIDRALGLLEPAIPAVRDAFNGRAWLDSWPDDPWAGGSYMGWRPGQWTKFWGSVGLPEEGIHFAGEHTSTVSQGFLDGAVESGERAAAEILTALGRTR